MFVDGPSLEMCRPFQEGSRGFTAGEASVGFVVSRRPGGAYANVLGGAMTHDGYHAISIAPGHERGPPRLHRRASPTPGSPPRRSPT